MLKPVQHDGWLKGANQTKTLQKLSRANPEGPARPVPYITS
jgi:hypothetical protein